MIASDFALQNLFRRLDSAVGERSYDRFKTRIANNAMRDSLADTEGYCISANQNFSVSMSLATGDLELFLLTQEFSLTEKVSPCNIVSPRRENGVASLASDEQR